MMLRRFIGRSPPSPSTSNFPTQASFREVRIDKTIEAHEKRYDARGSAGILGAWASEAAWASEKPAEMVGDSENAREEVRCRQ